MVKVTIYMHTYINMNFPKTKVVSGKTPLFVIGQIVLIILFVLTLDFDRVVLRGNVVFCRCTFKLANCSPVFQKKVVTFHKSCLKV